MTREEAIKYGKEQLEIFGGIHRKFITMAIEALQEQEHDGCKGCRYGDKEPADEPCKRCRNNYLNLWEPEPKAKEFTADDLIGAFRDAFVERRAIGILDIENKVKELFE